MTQRTRSRVQAAEMSFLLRVVGLGPGPCWRCGSHICIECPMGGGWGRLCISRTCWNILEIWMSVVRPGTWVDGRVDGQECYFCVIYDLYCPNVKMIRKHQLREKRSDWGIFWCSSAKVTADSNIYKKCFQFIFFLSVLGFCSNILAPTVCWVSDITLKPPHIWSLWVVDTDRTEYKCSFWRLTMNGIHTYSDESLIVIKLHRLQ